MEFARQEYFWLLWVIPFIAIFWGLGVWHQWRMRDRFGNLANMVDVSRISWGGRGLLRGFLFVASVLLMVLALAYPRTVVRELKPVPTPTDLVFLLDISPSMFAKDNDPTRLGRAEQIIQKFILLKQPQDRYALITFNYTSVVLSYLTADPQTILVYFDYLNQTEEPEAGSNMGSAMTSALRLIDNDIQMNPELSEKRRRVFVLISDGDDNIGEWAAPLREVQRREIKTYTFGLGSASGAYVPLQMSRGGQIVKYLTREGGARIVSQAQAQTMREISDRTGATFYRGEDERQIDRALDDILVQGRPIAGYQANPVREDLYEYFLMAAFASLILGIFL
jgi:Ca-activated chloride channel family protein